MVDKITELWGTLSRKVLASVLIDDGAVFPVTEIIKGNSKWFAPKERPVWLGVVQCLSEQVPPTVEAVTARTNGHIEPGYIQHIASSFNDDDNRHLVYNAEQLKDVGILVSIREVGKDLVKIDNLEEVSGAVDRASTELAGLYADRNDRKSDAQSVDNSAWGQVENFSGKVVPTGLNWFDQIAGGLWSGMNYWVVAAYKSGKSTLMRNMVLSAALKGHSVSAYCAEGTREMFVLDCQAMLAAKMIVDELGFDERKSLRLSGLFIMQSWTKHRDKGIFTPIEYTALQEARKKWRTLPIRTYDTRDSIRNLSTFHYGVKRDRMKYGTEAVYLDYSQLFGKGDKLFERQSETALKIQEICQNEETAAVILAQKNEEHIKAKDSYSPGVKGGGDAAAAADFLFEPEIDRDSPFMFRVNLKLSRHTRRAKGAHHIDTASGLILRDFQTTPLDQ